MDIARIWTDDHPLITHYQFPICPEWEEIFLREKKNFKTRIMNNIGFYVMYKNDEWSANMTVVKARKTICKSTETALVIDQTSSYFGSILYGVNRWKDNFFWLLWRWIEEPELMRDIFSNNWQYMHSEKRIDNTPHRKLAKELYEEIS